MHRGTVHVFSYLFYSLSIAFSYANLFGKGSKLVINFVCLSIGHTPQNLLDLIAYEANFIVFKLFYAHTALWERPSLCPYKLTPPIFQKLARITRLKPKL